MMNLAIKLCLFIAFIFTVATLITLLHADADY